MKKSLFVLGVAVAALASCTNEEVVSVPEGSYIGFNAFVDNTTKAVEDMTTNMGTDFYVIGYHGSSNTATDMTTPVFKNEISTSTYTWELNEYYRFGAYSNGKSKIDDAEFAFNEDDSEWQLTFPGYTPAGLDLVAAISNEIHPTGTISADNPGKVALSFKHLLSKIRFTISTKIGDGYTLKISDMKFTATKTADGAFDGTDVTWTAVADGSNGEYTFEEIADLANLEYETTTEDGTMYTTSVENVVIPQASTVSPDYVLAEVSFTVNLQGDNIDEEGGITKTFTADLSSTTDNAWKAGFAYNYTTEITMAQISEELDKLKIEFEPSVTKWDETTPGIEITPTEKP